MHLPYTSVSNLRRTGSPDQVTCDVKFEHIDTIVRFTASKNDPGAEHSEEIYRDVLAGKYGPITPYEGEE